MKRLYCCFLILGLVFITISNSYAQYLNISTDSIFSLARHYAFNGEKQKARMLCDEILKRNENYLDARILKGRTYAWEAKFDSARIQLNKVLEQKPNYYDALDALIDVEYWADHGSCIEHCNNALKLYPTDGNFTIKKAKALNALDQPKEAIKLLENFLKTDSLNKDVSKLLQEIKTNNKFNKLTLSYAYTYFEKGNSPWHLAYLQYLHKTKMGSVIGRLNYGYRFDSSNWQIEADAYPKLSKSFYLYLNVGYSPSASFPVLRSGVDLYYNMPKAFESSIGFRYLKFSTSDVIIYTAYLGKYIGNYWLGGRIFVTPSSTGTSVSGMFLLRKYFEDADHYLGIRLSYGTSPDDRRKDISTSNAVRLKSDAVRLEYNKKIKQRWILNGGLVFENEETKTNEFRNIYTIDFSVAHIF